MDAPRGSHRPFFQIVSLLLCYTFIAPSFAINSSHGAVIVRAAEPSAATPKSESHLLLPQSGGSAPMPGAPGPNLPNLDEVRQLQPSSAGPPPGSPSLCDECPPPDPTPTPTPANHPPNAVISSVPNSGYVGETLTFYGSNSFDVDAGDSIINYLWNFGDGTQPISGQNPIVSHVYSAPSATSYIVSLTVTDSHNTTNTTTTSIVINTPASLPVNDAAFVSQSQIPTSMTTGQQLAVWVKMKNTGTGTWQNDPAAPHKLGSQTPQDNSSWGTSRVQLASSVASGQEATFSFTITAPAFTGTYIFQWRMVQDGVTWFGVPSQAISITVFAPAARPQKAPFDFDGDGKTDIAVWNPTEGNWYIVNSRDDTNRIQYDWGRATLGDRLVPGDYNGDGLADLAVWRPADGNYYIIQISDGDSLPITAGWGQSGDFPVPGDYDGDGKTDVAVWRPSEGNWYIKQSQTNTTRLQNWGASSDVPVPGDYDGDGKTDLAVWRPSEGNWYIVQSSSNAVRTQSWGSSGDQLIPGDYDGDGRTDLAVWRPLEGNFYILQSTTNTGVARGWGNPTDVPVPGDYDGDGKIDVAVWRPSEGTWYILNSSTNTVTTKYLGGLGDVTVPSAYVRRTGNAAMFIAQSVPSTMYAGQKYNVTIRLRNIGTTTWTAGAPYRLASQNPQSNQTWGLTGSAVPYRVEPGADATFTYAVTAPSTPGTYNFQWQMVQDGPNEWFGDFTPNRVISVNNTPAGGVTTATNLAMALLDPRNRTGASGEDLLSGNFNWSVPLVSLAGRAGMDLSLSLSYNSRVWTRVGSTITYDADKGYPGAGFRLGFPVIQGPFYNDQAQRNAYLMITPSGGHFELRQVGDSDTYEAVDSSYTQMVVGNNGDLLVRSSDGTQLTYSLLNGQYHCTNLKDRNGNYITAEYHGSGKLRLITDTLSRSINFIYDSNTGELIEITQSRGGATHKWATFGYSRLTIQTNFRDASGSPLGVQGIGNVNIAVLTQVGLPDRSRYNFAYTPWGQVFAIKHYGSDGHLRRYSVYSLPGGQSAQTDCPRFTERRDWAEYWNIDSNGIPADYEEVATTFSFDPNSAWGQVRMPDGTIYKESYGTHDWQRGLTIGSQTFSADNLTTPQKTLTINWTQDNVNLNYRLNPRQVETAFDDANGNHQRITTHYTAYGLPSDIYEYGATGSTILRRKHLSYNLDDAYITRRLIGLVSEQYLYGKDPLDNQEKLYSKVTYQYDQPGEHMTHPGVAVCHDEAQYHAGLVEGRGNVTTTRRWDVNNPDNESQAVSYKTGYYSTGTVRFTRDPLGHQMTIGYTDSFTDGLNRNTLAYPTTVMDPDSYQASSKYDYDMGVITKATDAKGAELKTEYDEAGRIEKVINQTNGLYTRYFYGPYYVQSYSLRQENGPEAYAISVFDGDGRVRATAADHPGSVGRYKAQYMKYDVMGRLFFQSNPAEITVEWVASGDDAAGWLYSSQNYDWKGRPTLTINTDYTTRKFEYSGCGCAGGEVITNIDEMGRRQKTYLDAFGRAVKKEIMNSDGLTVYTTGVNIYNARDQVISSRQYQGQETSGTYQESLMSFDGHGRLVSIKAPEQDSPTIYSYHPDDTTATETDARGASITYSYNNRHLVTSAIYDTPEESNIPVSAPVSYEYDAMGNRTLMNDGLGSVTYEYDTLSRLKSESRRFNDLPLAPVPDHKYTLSYEYTLSGQLKKITDPFNASISYGYDLTDRLNSVTGAGFGNVSQYASNIQYRAWDASKGFSYSNYSQQQNKISYTFDARMRVRTYNVSYTIANTATHGSTFDYWYDGRVKFSTQLTDSRHDRSYTYDQLGRLTQALTGAEAHGVAGAPLDNVPFKQNYQYDVWDNLKSRAGHYWGQNMTPLSVSYNTNNRNPAWNYDAQGHILHEGSRDYRYDAAGRNISVTEPPLRANRPGVTITKGFDGEGRRVKTTHNGTTTYELRSTLFEGSTVTDLNAQGGKAVGYVYANGGLLAKQAGNAVLWIHRDPDGSGQWETNSESLGLIRTLQLDPLLIDVGLDNPSTNDGVGGGDGRSYPGYGDTSGPNQCSVDGFVMPCNWLIKVVRRDPIRLQMLSIKASIGGPTAITSTGVFYDGDSILLGTTTGHDKDGQAVASVTVKGTPEVLKTEVIGYAMNWLNLRELNFIIPQNFQDEIQAKRKTKFNQERFENCLRTLFNVEYQSNFFTYDQNDAYSTFRGKYIGDKYWVGEKIGGERILEIYSDHRSYTRQDLRIKKYGESGVALGGGAAGAIRGWTDYWKVNAIANEGLTVAEAFGVWVHELGNSLSLETGHDPLNGLNEEQKADLQRRFDHLDAGVVLEDCVFGGPVQENGGVVRGKVAMPYQ